MRTTTNPNHKISLLCRERAHNQCKNPLCVCACHRKGRTVAEESKTFQQVADEALAKINEQSQTITPDPLERFRQSAGQAITSLAYAKRDLEDARGRGDTDMMRWSAAFREAEADVNRAVGALVDAIIASERGNVPNALGGA